jgi:phosphatidylglycerophosphate synthase
MLLQRGSHCAALVVLVVCAASDFLDGYLARRFDVESKFGALLDPVADKIFLNCAIWGLSAHLGWKLEWVAIAVILTLRDLVLLVIGGISIVTKRSIDMKPVMLSKVCTALVFGLCVLTLILDHSNLLLRILRPLCLVCICLTAAIYARRGYRSLTRTAA